MANSGNSRKHSGKTADVISLKSQRISSEERQRMIAEAAYFRAMRRSFDGGDPVNDWLIAEREINNLLTDGDNRRK